MTGQPIKPTVAIHKFSSCDGCQLALLNLGEQLLELARMVEIRHFVEAGPIAEQAEVDIAFVEGSISTAEGVERIKRVRAHSKYLVAIGACATSGGLQALRNLDDAAAWTAAVYAHPEHISVLDRATPLADHVRVDLELFGCPVNGHQVLAAVRALLSGVTPVQSRDKLCGEFKRFHNVCVMVAKGLPCMGPVTGTGFGCTEAPRGMLWQRWESDGEGRITAARIVPPTSQNQPRMEEDLRLSLEAMGLDQSDDALRLRAETVIRNYDPCISCATHFLKLSVRRG